MIPTAKEFIRSDKGDNLYIVSDGDESNIAEIMIEFAKLHVEAALKEAEIVAQATWGNSTLMRNSIPKAYPLTNIK